MEFGFTSSGGSTSTGALVYKGSWNALLNNPVLVSGVGVISNYYVVSVAGSTNLDGITDWNVGDWAIFNGTVWQKIDNTSITYSGNWDANTNTPTLVSSVGNEGNFYIVSVAGATNLNGINVWNIGDWAIFSNGVWNKIPNSTVLTGIGVANEIAYWTAPNNLSSLTTATYPSLIELSYVKGVSSDIQTQLNGKEPTIITLPISKGGTNSGTALTNNKVMISAGGQIIEGDTTTYPSTTELSYVKGVTSAIQTQLNNKLTDTSWIDYSATSTIIGWSSYTTLSIKYKIVGNIMFVNYAIYGTSNSNTTSFTLPNNAIVQSENQCRVRNNGVWYHGLGLLLVASNVVSFSYWATVTTYSSVWTAAGSKVVSGQIFFEI